MNSPNSAEGGLAWVVDRFVQDVDGVSYAVVLSADGLALAEGGKPSPDHADRLAAVASGVFYLASSISQVFDLSSYEHSILRFADGSVVVTAMAKGAALAVVTDRGARLGIVSHEMALFAGRVGENFDLAPRKVVAS